jgi:PEP-CTERM motif
MTPQPALARLAAVLALTTLAAASAAAQTVVAPIAYDMPNGYGQANMGSYNYWDKAYTGSGNTSLDFDPLSGGLGDLTDGVIATQRWDMVENAEGTGPYVGWAGIDPVITFHFGQVHSFSQVKIWHDDADGYGNVATPMGFTVTVGAQSQYFAITDPVGDVPFASTLVLGAGFTGSSLQLQVHRFDTATMLSEVQISAVPEPASAALMLLGAAGLLVLRRRS